MVEALLKFVTRENLFSMEDDLLLAVSGGKDSMVMAQLFLNAGIPFAIAHVNYNLRGKDSIADRDFVRNWAQENNIPVYIKEVKGEAFKSGKSTQMMARDIRYAYFNQLMHDHGYTKVATAHHANDSFETILLHLVKGTGPAGMRGIPIKNGDIIRPMMFANRQEISDYAESYGLQWREDASNFKNDYQRNFIRNEVTNRLHEINPSLMETFVDTQFRLAATADVVDEAKSRIESEFLTYQEGHTELDLRWMNNKPAEQLILSEIMMDYGMNFSQCKDLFSAIIAGKVGKLFHTPDQEINLDRGKIIIRPTEGSPSTELVISKPLGNARINNSFLTWYDCEVPDQIDLGSEVAFLDLSRVQWPLRIRTWQEGDAFVPLGMTGKKKVSDYMIDCKIPLSLKRQVLVLLSGEEIAWLVGLRISDHFKITDQTTSVLKITVNNAPVF